MNALAWTVAILVMMWPPAAAVALDITFDDVRSVGNPLVTTLDTHGYRFTGVFSTIDRPGALLASSGSPVYLGQDASGPGITVTRADGGLFSLYEFDAAGLHVPSPGGPDSAAHVGLVGYRVDGTTLGVSYQLPGLAQFAHFAVPGTWADLQAVTFAGHLSATTPGALALDDVGVGEGPTNVPEPGTLGLVILTALGLGGPVLRRRGSRPPVRHR